jgi:serine/threonine protein kinase
MIARAARTIAESMGLADTMVDVLRARAFQPYAEGLRQYLTIRLGSVAEGSAALAELRLIVAGERATRLIEPPGVRGQLYRRARSLVEARWERETGVAGGDRERLPWRKPPAGMSMRYRSALAQVRLALTEGESELLELRFARELASDEAAFVLGTTVEEAEERFEHAWTKVADLLRTLYPSEEKDAGILLVEAFALEPLPEGAGSVPGRGLGGLPPGTVIGGRYEIDAQVGSGGMGAVYRAKDTEVPGHVVALKLLHQAATSDAARQAALRELHLIASVFHPSVVQFKDHGWHEGRFWFVMPWYEGETLETRIRRDALTRAEARPIFQQLSRALATMHSVGIRHQDIKPDNIFLARIEGLGLEGDQRFLPVLIDLGVAAKEAEAVLAGTPIYFAPEVAGQYARVAAARSVTSKADVFSLCLSLRNALAPESQEDVAAGAVERFIEHRAVHAPAPPRSTDLAFLKGHFERWLSLDPDARPTAEALAEELAVLTEPEDRRTRRLALLRWLGPLLIALVVVFASVVFGLSRQAEYRKAEAAQARVEAQHARNQAERAQLEAVDVREDLSQAEEQVSELETEIAKTLRASKLSHEQLTNKLARAESVSQVLKRQIVLLQQQAALLGEERDAAQALAGRLAGDLDRTRADLAGARDQVARLDRTVDELRESLSRSQTDLQAAQEQASLLTSRVGSLEGQLAREREAVERLGAQLTAAEGARDQAQAQLALARREVERLEAQLTAAENTRDHAQSQLVAARREVEQLERQLTQCRSGGGGDSGASQPDVPPIKIAPRPAAAEPEKAPEPPVE